MKNNKTQNLRDRFKKLVTSNSDEETIKRDAQVLMGAYLSEIERLYKTQRLNRAELAKEINVSGSYLTQVFSGAKPLNFLTLAKIKRALSLRFDVIASFEGEVKANVQSDQSPDFIIQIGNNDKDLIKWNMLQFKSVNPFMDIAHFNEKLMEEKVYKYYPIPA